MTEKQRKDNRLQRQKTIDFVNSSRTPCVKCGEDRLYIIDFHHIDNRTKEFNITRGVKGKGRKTIEDEIKKCVCLCRNCHAEFHYIYGHQPEHPVEALQEYLKGGDSYSVL